MNQINNQGKFFDDLTGIAFVFLLLKYAIWTATHFAALFVLLMLDNERIWSETFLSLFMIPIGLMNVALLVDGFRSLKVFKWNNFLYLCSAVGNFILYALFSMQMYNQAGSMTN